MGVMREYLMSNLWCYELPSDSITERDIEELSRYNLLYKNYYVEDISEFYIVGSYGDIVDYLRDYIGVDVNTDYLIPIKRIYQPNDEFTVTMW